VARVLIVEPTADGLLDLAIRAQQHGHSVHYWLKSYDQHKQPVGRGLVERVADWRSLARRVDLVILGSLGYCGREFDQLRAEGVPVIGAPGLVGEWELDRLVGMQQFKRAGIPVPPYRQCTNYDEAISLVSQRDDGVAIKPCGDVTDKSLSFVAKTPREAVWRLQRWKREGRRFPHGFILQELVEGVEFAVGGWIGPGGFAEGWEENFEEKRLFAGGVGPNCYSADTEVLTAVGWKAWPDVKKADCLATLNDGLVCYVMPDRLVESDFDGEMIGWRSNRVDLLVTPDHAMYVADRDTVRRGEPEFYRAAADGLAENRIEKKFAVLRVGRWAAPGNPSITPARARLLGMFLADGHCGQRSIVFGNCPAHKEALIRDAALACGYVAHRYGADVYINSRDLANAWRHFPKAVEKRAPQEIMGAAPDVIAAFLDGLALDAATMGNRVYTTASRGMADDIQIMLMRIGLAGHVHERDRRGEPERELGGYIIRGGLSWDVGVSSQALAWLRPRYCYRAPYRGKVYCATVNSESHALFVRRNGKACWSGNCGEAGTVMRLVARSKLADRVLKPLEDRLVSLGYVGNIDVNCIVDEDGSPWPLEFTARFGYPAINIELALHGDPIEFLAGLAAGKPPKTRRLDEVAVGVVCALPPYPYREKPDETVGVPIWGVTPGIEDNIHLCMAQVGEFEKRPTLMTAGSYVLVSTGTGESVVAARNEAYRVLDRLTIPASPFWRNDIGSRLSRDVPRLQEHGYAAGLRYSAAA